MAHESAVQGESGRFPEESGARENESNHWSGPVVSTVAIYAGTLIPDLLQARLADFLNAGGDNWCGVLRMAEFHMHPASDETAFNHGASPSRASNGYLNWFGTILGMP